MTKRVFLRETISYKSSLREIDSIFFHIVHFFLQRVKQMWRWFYKVICTGSLSEIFQKFSQENGTHYIQVFPTSAAPDCTRWQKPKQKFCMFWKFYVGLLGWWCVNFKGLCATDVNCTVIILEFNSFALFLCFVDFTVSVDFYIAF